MLCKEDTKNISDVPVWCTCHVDSLLHNHWHPMLSKVFQAASVNTARQFNSVAANPTGKEGLEWRERERLMERLNQHQKVCVAVVHSEAMQTN